MVEKVFFEQNFEMKILIDLRDLKRPPGFENDVIVLESMLST